MLWSKSKSFSFAFGILKETSKMSHTAYLAPIVLWNFHCIVTFGWLGATYRVLHACFHWHNFYRVFVGVHRHFCMPHTCLLRLVTSMWRLLACRDLYLLSWDIRLEHSCGPLLGHRTVLWALICPSLMLALVILNIRPFSVSWARNDTGQWGLHPPEK